MPGIADRILYRNDKASLASAMAHGQSMSVGTNKFSRRLREVKTDNIPVVVRRHGQNGGHSVTETLRGTTARGDMSNREIPRRAKNRVMSAFCLYACVSVCLSLHLSTYMNV